MNLTGRGSAVSCVACEQILTDGRCTNELCPGYFPVDSNCERLSQCCGRPEHYGVPNMCGCGDWTGFECSVHGCLWEAGFAGCPEAGTPSPEAPDTPPCAPTLDTSSESAPDAPGEVPTLDTLVVPPDPEDTIVVNRRREAFDVYIGRGSKWGNPFHIGPDGLRATVIRKYEGYIQGRTHLMNALHELRGKRLGCYCKPLACHGDVLRRLVIEQAKPVS